MNGNFPTNERYKTNISPFTKYHQLKTTFHTYTLYEKVPLLSGNEISQVFNSGDFIFVAPMNSNIDRGIGLMDICDDNKITE